MENLKWFPFLYNGNETNIEATSDGRLRKLEKEWYGKGKGKSKIIYGEIYLDFKRKSKNGYIQIKVQIKNLPERTFMLHQIMAAIFLNHKFGNRNLVVDHIDSNKLNNNIKNLRVITIRENCSKEKTILSGMPVGVHLHKSKNKYVSRIFYNGKKHHLGYYDNIEEASIAYKNKLMQL